MSETRGITTPIIQALEKMGLLCFRMNSGKLRVRGGYVHLAKKGTGDILTFKSRRDGFLDHPAIPGDYKFIRAIPIWIETKALDGKLSDDQKKFKDEVEAMGHIYVVARSLDDVLAVIG